MWKGGQVTTPRVYAGRFVRAGQVSLLLLMALVLVSGCAANTASSAAGTALRLGFFPNLNHAPGLVGDANGTFDRALAPLGATVESTLFNAGPDVVTALFSDQLDIAYIGPNPTVNAFVQSKGRAINVIAGAASGGAALVVKPGIRRPADLKGKTLATPQLGNTQDVALRYWLKQQGLSSNPDGGGDVNIKPQANSEGLTAFGAGQIDGAWVPEPFVSEYVKKGAKVLVDEASQWPGGQFVTTNVVVRKEFLEEHPTMVEAFLAAHVAEIAALDANPTKAQADTIAAIKSLTGKAPKPDVVASAWSQLTFTSDPLQRTLLASAQHAIDVGLLDKERFDRAGDPNKLYDLALLNRVLKARGMTEVTG